MGALAAIEIEIVTDASAPDWPRAEFLVDGLPMLAGTSLSDWMGFDPGSVLTDDLPLLPDAPWRRVAVYRCGCGEAGCGVVAPMIVLSTDGVVRWTDFRDYTGVFVGPTVDDDPHGGKAHKLPELRFDRAQYEAEVLRATHDRSWETNGRATARLVQQRLGQQRSLFHDLGLRLNGVFPERSSDAVTIALREGRRDILLAIPAGVGSPDERAGGVIAALWSTPPAEWQRTFSDPRR